MVRAQRRIISRGDNAFACGLPKEKREGRREQYY
jgi:hypothetical protein